MNVFTIDILPSDKNVDPPSQASSQLEAKLSQNTSENTSTNATTNASASMSGQDVTEDDILSGGYAPKNKSEFKSSKSNKINITNSSKGRNVSNTSILEQPTFSIN